MWDIDFSHSMERKLRLRGVQSFVYLTNCKNCGDSLGLWVLTVEQERLKIWKSVHLALSHTFHFGKPAKENTAGTLQTKPTHWPSGKSLVCKTGITARFHGFLVKLSEGPSLGAPRNDVCFGFIYLLTWMVFRGLLRVGS